MAMTADDTFSGSTREIDPGTLGDVVHQWTKPNPFAPRHPHTVIIFFGVYDEFVFGFGWKWDVEGFHIECSGGHRSLLHDFILATISALIDLRL